MSANPSKRATGYFDANLHRALRLKAAAADRSISDLVNEAVQLSLGEDAADLAAFDERQHEPTETLDAFVKRLDAKVLIQARKRAARSGLTLTAVIEQALRESFTGKKRREQPSVRLPSWGQGWVLPDIDLDDSASLLDLMEREDAPP